MPESLNVTMAVPTDHDAEVDALVHVPDTVHASEPNAIYEAAALMFTLPEMLTAPDVEVSAPPDNTRLPLTVRVYVDFARLPEDTVSAEAVNWLACVMVPVMVSVANACPAARVMVLDVPVKVTVEDVEVNEVADEVFQLPAMERVEDPKVTVADPEDVRFELKVGIALVKVRVPDHVMADVNVVVIPELTVRLARVCGMLTVPEDVPTTTVPLVVKDPAEVSIDLTVRVEAFAVNAPSAATVRVIAVRERFEADVLRVVVPAPP